MLHAGRVGHRAQHIKQGAHAELFARADGILHGTVMIRRKHKANTDFADCPGDLLRFQVQVNTCGFQQVRATTGRRHRTVAMFGYMTTGSGNHKGRCSRDIKQVGAIAAGTAGVHRVGDIQLNRGCQFAHHFNRCGDLIQSFAFHAQGYQKAADLSIGTLTGHDLTHDVAHLFPAQIQLFYHFAQSILNIHGLGSCFRTALAVILSAWAASSGLLLSIKRIKASDSESSAAYRDHVRSESIPGETARLQSAESYDADP